MDKNSKALKSGVWYVLSNLVVRGITLISTPIFSRLLTHEQYGAYSNFLSWSGIAIIVITMRMESSLISAKFDYAENLGEYNRSIIGLTTVITVTWLVIMNLFPSFFGRILGFHRAYYNLMLIYCLFYAIINIFQVNERYMYRYRSSVFVGLMVALSTTIVSIVLVLILPNRLTGRVLGGIVPIIVIGAAILLIFFRDGKRIDVSIWPYALRICIPYIPHLLSLQVLNQVDRIMITRICGAADNAMYTIAYTCGHMVTLLMTSMNSAFAPWIGDKLNEGMHGEIRRVSVYYMSFFSVLAVLMMLLAPEVLLIMGGKSYLSAKYVMPPVAMGCVCQFLYTMYVNIEQFEKKTVWMAFASVAAALLNYGLNAVYIPKYGFIAAAYTTLVGYLFLLIAHAIITTRLGKGGVYNGFFVAGLVTVMLCLTFCINWFYDHPIMRYAAIVLFGIGLCALLYIKRDILSKMVRRIAH